MAKTVATSEKIRIRVKAYEPSILDQSAAKIVDTAKKTGAKVSGPIPRSKSFRTYSITNKKGNSNSNSFSTQTQRFKRTI